MTGSVAKNLSGPAVLGLLADIESRSRAAAQRLPQSAPVKDVWDGLVFSVAGAELAAAMHEISEMLPYPGRLNRVPGAKPWMLGVANVRSSLLPIIDLQMFFGAKALVPSKASRILVLRMRGLVVGLLVPSVQGMRHFRLKDRIANARVKGALGAYVYESFAIDGGFLPVLSMAALAADPAFRVAAA